MKRKSLVILVAASLLLVILPKVRKYPNEGPEVKDASERAQALRSQKQKHTAAIPAGPMSFWKYLDDSPARASIFFTRRGCETLNGLYSEIRHRQRSMNEPPLSSTTKPLTKGSKFLGCLRRGPQAEEV